MSINVMTTYKGEMMIDYAYPCMMAEKALKSAHDKVYRIFLELLLQDLGNQFIHFFNGEWHFIHPTIPFIH